MCLNKVLYYEGAEKNHGWKVIFWDREGTQWLSASMFHKIVPETWMAAEKPMEIDPDHPANYGFHVFLDKKDAEALYEECYCSFKNLVPAVVEVWYRGILSIGLGDGSVDQNALVVVAKEIFYPESYLPKIS